MDGKKMFGGGGLGHQKYGGNNKWLKPEPSEDEKRQINGRKMYYHYCSGKWKIVDKTPSQITAAKKSAEGQH
jgi:hypothetical protein